MHHETPNTGNTNYCYHHEETWPEIFPTRLKCKMKAITMINDCGTGLTEYTQTIILMLTMPVNIAEEALASMLKETD